MPYKDPAKKRENAKAYLAAHPELEEVRRAANRRWYLANKPKVYAKAKAWKLENKDLISDLQREKKFGISRSQFEEMFAAQSGQCAICARQMDSRWGRRGNRLGACVDHDHKTNVIRELLCMRCNACLGQFEDSVDLLSKAIMYLFRHTKKVA